MTIELVGGPFCGMRPDAIKDGAWILLDTDHREHRYHRTPLRTAEGGRPIYLHDTIKLRKAKG